MAKHRKMRNLLTVEQALRQGKFKRTKCYRLIGEGRIIAFKEGGRTLIDGDSITAYHASLPRIRPNKDKAGSRKLSR